MSDTIKCPNCQTDIDIDEIFYHQIEEKFKIEHLQKEKKLQEEVEEKRKEYKADLNALKVKEELFKAQQDTFDEKLKKATNEQLKIEKQKLQETLKKELKAEQSESMALLQKELEEKSEQVKKLNNATVEISKLKREKDELASKAKAEAMKEFNQKLDEQKKKADDEQVKKEAELKRKFDEMEKEAKAEQLKAKELFEKELQEEQNESLVLLQKELNKKSEQVKELNNKTIEIAKLKREKDELASKANADAQLELNRLLAEEKIKLSKSLEEANELKLKAKDEQIEQMRRDIDNAKRKGEQSSMQVQGEALELVIESWLESQFPFDTIDEVKKGSFGADCIQTVNTRDILNCGTICYESKNTKAWSDSWIEKLKKDMIDINADIGVIVTSVYPKEMRRMGFVDGIWICSLDEFKGSASLLRESLIRVRQSMQTNENRADKMSLLYDYMTGTEFSMQMNAIVDGFTKMQDELAKEKRSLMASWKRREKTTEMYGSLQGIAGSSAIVHIEALELSEELEE